VGNHSACTVFQAFAQQRWYLIHFARQDKLPLTLELFQGHYCPSYGPSLGLETPLGTIIVLTYPTRTGALDWGQWRGIGKALHYQLEFPIRRYQYLLRNDCR
jgi:hypothetical protein